MVDVFLASLSLAILSPLLLFVGILVWLQDFRSPLYISDRVGRDGSNFRLVKFRSMVSNAERSTVDSTAADDVRITPLGRFLRRYKLDELPQLWNVLGGDMSLVGPRPNVEREVRLYTEAERVLLQARPGITDLASIVFADEAEILRGKPDPDLAYNQLIRPWKSRIGLTYVQNQSVGLDCQILYLTVLNIFRREQALERVAQVLRRLGADEEVCAVARRKRELVPHPPPGTSEIVRTR